MRIARWNFLQSTSQDRRRFHVKRESCIWHPSWGFEWTGKRSCYRALFLYKTNQNILSWTSRPSQSRFQCTLAWRRTRISFWSWIHLLRLPASPRLGCTWSWAEGKPSSTLFLLALQKETIVKLNKELHVDDYKFMKFNHMKHWKNWTNPKFPMKSSYMADSRTKSTVAWNLILPLFLFQSFSCFVESPIKWN